MSIERLCPICNKLQKPTNNKLKMYCYGHLADNQKKIFKVKPT